jgi:S1-C subfamily serine protease
MNRRRLLHALALACSAPGVGAEPLPDLIDRVKPSVVLVGSHGLLDSPRFGFRGTGFVVADGLTVITNAHVVPPETPGRVDRRLVVQVWSKDGQWQLREASLLTSDPMRDLAVLRLQGEAVPAVKLAEAEPREGVSIALVGFPLGGALGFSHVTHRGIVAARTSIAAAASNFQGLNERAVRQLRQGAFEILQLDAVAYPGNSGGPVFSLEDGAVVGVVSMVLVKGVKEAALSAASGITYAVPATAVAALLARVPAR